MQAAAGQGALGPCPDAELLGLYAERALGGDERPAVEAHVAGCARCQAALAVFVRSAPDEGAGSATGVGGFGRAWWQGWRWLVPVTATAVVVMLAVWVGRPPAPSEVTPAQEEAAAPAAAARVVPPEPSAVAGAAAPPGRQTEATRELAFRAPSGAERDRLAAGNRQAVPAAPPSDLAKQAATAAPAAARADAAVPAALADARERSAAAAAPPPPAPAATTEARETLAAPAPTAPAVTPQSPAALRAERNAAAKPGEMARAKSADTSANDAGRGVAAGGLAATATRRASGELTGRVTYRTRAALPSGAVVEVRLLDVSRADAPAAVLGRVEIVTGGEQVPIPFAVRYDPEAIDGRRRYALHATITIAGRVAYRTAVAHAVLTNGAPVAAVEVVAEPVP